MKILLTYICILLASFIVAGQETASQQGDSQKFSPAGEEFTVYLPKTPNIKSESRDNSSRRYYSEFEGTYFFIFVDTIERNNYGKSILNGEVLDFLGEFKPKKKKGFFGGLESDVFFSFDSEGFYHIILMVRTKKHIYTIQTTSLNEFDKNTQNFFSSLRILGEPLTLNSKPYDKISFQNNETIVLPEKTENFALFDTTHTDTAPLQILHKEKASYSRFARFYLIEGSVVARATFSATGSMGAIDPIVKLPFGLTKRTIEAIQKIKFRPAMKDGTPYTVTKQLKYSFLLY